MIPPEHEQPRPGVPEDARESASDSTAFVKRLEGQRPPSEKHSLVSEIARGAMGIIQKVWDADLQRYLAKKVILSRKPAAVDRPSEVDPQLLGRFLEEAQISGQLEHPGIVPVHEVGVDAEGRVYFTMQLVKGRELAEIFELAEAEREGWSTTRALGVILKVCEATAYAHDKGVVHRDLKPANVMVGRFGEAYVMDWGLAHVLGNKGRARDSKSSTTMLTLDFAREQSEDASGDSMRTMDGDVIGTPTFMSPQQARGRIADLDARADIYSVGAILYRLLAGQVPYVPRGEERPGIDVLRDLLEGPPTPILELRPDVPRELVAICEKAMARGLKDRYRDMQGLADDLRAFLEGRVVQAFETGAVAELKKWVTRNKGLAAALLTVIFLAIGGLAAVVYVEARGRRAADAQRQIALENEIEAKANEVIALRNAEQARRERANVLRLSAFQRIADLQAEAADLWPPLPDRIGDFESWLSRASELAAGLHPDESGDNGGHYEQLEILRARALPADPGVDEEHARFPELSAKRLELEARTAARAVRRGGPPLDPFDLGQERRRRPAAELNQLAWPLVNRQRVVFGRESEGMALARLALARATTDKERAEIGDSLAWAYFACGRDDRALAASRAALALVGPAKQEEYEGYIRDLEQAIEQENGEPGDLRIEALEDAVEDLEELIADERPLRFASDDDRWWCVQLEKLVAEIEAFAHPESGLIGGRSPTAGWGIERRVEFARTVRSRTIEGPEARRAWDSAIASIRDRDTCPAYDGLEIEPQLGLVPIGRDPQSGLWEFAHTMSGDIPIRGSDGVLGLDDDTCLVLILVPGGTFTMGSQNADPEAPNYAAEVGSRETPVHLVELAPFLISKNEITQGQWLRIAGANPSRYNPDTSPTNIGTMTLAHPVESVSWTECALWLERMNLELPTEAQWEYAARAGSTTRWWTGSSQDSLVGAANLADQSAARAGATWPDIADWPELDDGWPVHGTVGSLAANTFGLHDVHGNVKEWCRERRGSYSQPVAKGDGERIEPNEAGRVFRGGSYANSAIRTRSGARSIFTMDQRFNDLGVRPARSLE